MLACSRCIEMTCIAYCYTVLQQQTYAPLQAAGGAVAGAGAAFNAVAGNLLGLVVTPALVLLALPGAIPGEVQLTKQLIKLGSQVRASKR
jgi:predicted Na+-dependent transporter